MEEEKKEPQVKTVKKREIKLQEIKEKKKNNPNKMTQGLANSFATRVIEKDDGAQIVSFVNQEIVRHNAYKKTKKGQQEERVMKAIEKFEATGLTLLDQENIFEVRFNAARITLIIQKMVTEMIKNGTHADSLAVPQILVLTPDTQVVVDVCKELKTLYAEPTATGVEIKIQKLFSKHISIEEHQKWLSHKRPGQYINIFVGVPNRVKKLIELDTIKVSNKAFKTFLIDSTLNSKNFTIFDIYETRDDLYDIFLLSQKRILKRKLKIYVH